MTSDSLIPMEEHEAFHHTFKGFIYLTYTLQCEDRYEGVGCKSCSSGWYGIKCDMPCKDTDRYSCNTETGVRICKYPYFGFNCDVKCHNELCSAQGYKICPEKNGEADLAAVKLENNFRNCEVDCLPFNGSFICIEEKMWWCTLASNGSNVCRDCLPNNVQVKCSPSCRPHLPRYDCKISNRSEAGEEQGEVVCQIGWTGPNCNKCQDGWYGSNCEVFCNSTKYHSCNGLGEKIPRGCGNQAGNWKFSESGCNCIENWYGEDCLVYCESNPLWNCDPISGKKICNDTRTGQNCSRCAEDYYPRGEVLGNTNCTFCKETDRYRCTDTGKLNCTPPWIGSECEEKCEDTHRIKCNYEDQSVTCRGNFTGPKCEQCKLNHYGANCSHYCLPGDRVQCNIITGEKTCKKNYYVAPNCHVFCAETTKYRCLEPSGQKICKDQHRDNKTLCEKCIKPYYGEFCNITCIPPSLNYECGSSGELICKENWKGIHCDICADNWFSQQCEGSDDCEQTCDTWCKDLINFKCNKNGILEMTAEKFVPTLDFMDEVTYDLIVGGVLAVFFLFVLLLCVIIYLHFTRTITFQPTQKKQYN